MANRILSDAPDWLLPDAKDDPAAVAQRKVEKLTDLVRRYPGEMYYELCLRGWLAALAKETQGDAKL